MAASQLEVTLNDAAFRRAVTGMREYLSGSRTVMIVIGRGMVDAAKEHMRTNGEDSWPPLSHWTVMRTGRSKPLAGLERLITYEADAYHARVFARRPGGGWDLDMHARGYTTPARRAVYGDAMRIPVANGRPIFRREVGPSRVPARPWMPNREAVRQFSREAVVEWVAEGARRIWH